MDAAVESSQRRTEQPKPATIVRVAPARVNLLGEHTDYTGGSVLPMAIPFFTRAQITPAAGSSFQFRSAELEGGLSLPADVHGSVRSGAWTDYPLGVLQELEALGHKPPPFDLELSGNVPFGAGLSSSASVEVASCLAMLALTDAALSAAEVALLCQRAENDFVGSPCGIMDQFVVTAAQAGQALLLNTRDLSYELIPMNTGALAGTCIVVVNSEVKHSITDGTYGDRRKEVEAGQAVVRGHFPQLQDLGAATLAQLEQCAGEMTRASYMRCRHIVTENGRVRSARAAMLAGDAEQFGKLMVLSHLSQRDDFECSVAEIDFLVDTAIELPGCLGARLTGGGFGGCTVNLVERGAVEAFTVAIERAYRQRFGIAAATYVCEAVDGAVARIERSEEQPEIVA